MHRFKITLLTIILALLFIPITGLADEGMWMPHQMKMLDLEKQGLKMNPDDLYKSNGTGLMSAVVDLGGGTGSFVSDKGLIFTNHHVAFGALQRASDPEHNYIENGFMAKTFKEEIQAPGYTAGVLLSYKEVTKKIENELKKSMAPITQYKTVDLIKKKLIKEAESKGPDLFAEIGTVYAGNQYYLFVYKKIKDVRIVYAPPRDIGNFGGEVDNWMWPRHTCDFTFLRAYVSPSGEGVEYSPDNVPYEPNIHFQIAKDPLKENDFTFIMGYPGKTYRNFSTSELMFDIDLLKDGIEYRLELIDFFEEAAKKSKAIEIKYATMLKRLYNGLKNYRGKLEGFEKAGIVEKKKEKDSNFEKWSSEKKKRSKKYSGIVEKINQFYEKEYIDFYKKESGLRNLTSYWKGTPLLAQAHMIIRNSIEQQKPDMERDELFQERSVPKLKSRIKLAERRYEIETEKSYIVLRLSQLAKKGGKNIPAILQKILDKKGGLETWVETAFKNTKITDSEYRLSLLKKSPDELKKLDDHLLFFAFELENELAELRKQKEEMDQKKENLKRIYIKGLLEMNNNNLAPDANSTIRFTSGHVKGYSPKDAMYYKPFTTLKGVIEKDKGEYPFNVHQKLKTLHTKKDFGNYADPCLGDVPTCFMNTTNVTGGNSGSPTLNANGEIVGIVFDMTYESVIGDYYIIPEFQRVISADIRYVLFITEKYSGAIHLIKEMGL